ncbi:hypothetical protein BDN72DRAFT_875774 [Pluteus cervinus]|uniref:Uncharacterized protein n=1 Tax=Pluteus cervinus TaxID=181527 RepID=A0ACD3B786_9AGAR|nr:hypothetical protein BDN72DRAFT_875774 [Pluteus cervinus]
MFSLVCGVVQGCSLAAASTNVIWPNPGLNPYEIKVGQFYQLGGHRCSDNLLSHSWICKLPDSEVIDIVDCVEVYDLVYDGFCATHQWEEGIVFSQVAVTLDPSLSEPLIDVNHWFYKLAPPKNAFASAEDSSFSSSIGPAISSYCLMFIIHLDNTYFQLKRIMGIYLAIVSILCQCTIISSTPRDTGTKDNVPSQ